MSMDLKRKQHPCKALLIILKERQFSATTLRLQRGLQKIYVDDSDKKNQTCFQCIYGFEIKYV